MGLRNQAKKWMYQRPKGKYILDLPVDTLKEISCLLLLEDKKSYRLVCRKLQLAGGVDMFSNVKIDIAACAAKNSSLEKEPDYNEFLDVLPAGRPECWIVIRQRNDIYNFALSIMQGNIVAYLRYSVNVCIRLSALTFGFGCKIPQTILDLKSSNYTEQSLWLVEKAIPKYCHYLQYLEILVGTYDGTVQHISPVMKMIKQMPAVSKSISSHAYRRLMNKDPTIPNVHRYRVTTREFGYNVSVPETVRQLEYHVVAAGRNCDNSPVAANKFRKYLQLLPYLQELSLSGLSIDCSYQDQWLPESVDTLEVVIDHRHLNRSLITFPQVTRLKLHMVSSEISNPFEYMRFPNLEYLYIRERCLEERDESKLPVSTMTRLRELQIDVVGADLTYLPRLLSHFQGYSSRMVERLILSGTFACQEFMQRVSGFDVQEHMAKYVVPKLKRLRSLVLHCGPETVANSAIVRAFLELPFLEEMYVYPSVYWDRSGLSSESTGFLRPAMVNVECRNTESEFSRSVRGYQIDIHRARFLGDDDWLPRSVVVGGLDGSPDLTEQFI